MAGNHAPLPEWTTAVSPWTSISIDSYANETIV
jgi:hypothetical protein